jgi:hypothetical protein
VFGDERRRRAVEMATNRKCCVTAKVQDCHAKSPDRRALFQGLGE